MTHTVQRDSSGGTVDPDQPTSLVAFAQRFPNDAACAAYLAGLRWPDGYVCDKCGSTRGHEIPTRPGVWTCHKGHQTSLTAGTVMHRTKMPLTAWFYGAYLASTLTPGISALQFQKQLGIANYEAAFHLLHKLRSAMVDPDREPLRGEVQIDEAFIGGELRGGKRGRGATANKALVIVAVEIRRWDAPDPMHPGDPDSAVQKVRAGRIRATVIPNAQAATLLPWVADNVQRGSLVYTDGLTSYSGLPALGYEHVPVLQTHEGKSTGQHLPMVDLIISNLKRTLLGTYRGSISTKHLQAYLNEYVFRFNRRFWRGPAFLRALGLAVQAERRPEYETLYKGQWVHPNPRPTVDADEISRRVDAVWRAMLDKAPDEGMRAWMRRREISTRAAIQARLLRGEGRR